MTRLLAVLALSALAAPAVAAAQDSTPRGPVIVGPVIHITPARPSAVILVARSRPEPRVEDMRASFTPEIVAATGGAPF